MFSNVTKWSIMIMHGICQFKFVAFCDNNNKNMDTKKEKKTKKKKKRKQKRRM